MAPSSRSTSRGPDRPCSDTGILLLDCDAPFREGLAALLRDDGHRVQRYAVPQTVPALATLSWVGIVVAARESGGFAFADRFHAAHPGCRVLLLTAYRTRSIDAAAALRPFVHMMEKPIEYDDLHTQIHALAR
jgi:DNA-binding NtrC family response regulator